MNASRGRNLASVMLKYRGVITSTVGAILALSALIIDGGGSRVMADSFGACTASMYIMQADSGSGPTVLSTISINSEEEFVLTPEPGVPLYNAAGFNEVDFFIYALRVATQNTSELIKVHSNGATENVPVHSDITIPRSVSADVGPDQMMYIYEAGNLFRLDLKNLSQSNALQGAKLDEALPPSGMADIAYHQGALYGVTTASKHLVRLDLSTAEWGAVTWNPGKTNYQVTGNISTKIYDSSINAELTGDEVANGGFGAMFGGHNGVYGNNNEGGFYSFDINTGLGTYLGDAAPSAQNDGAKCYSTVLTLPSKIQVRKESYPDSDNPQPVFAPGKKTAYRIVVDNLGKFAIPGIQISDPLPPGITTATWKCEQPEVNCTPVSGTGPLNAIVSIPKGPGSQISFLIEVDVPADYTDPLVNTVTMELPPLASQSSEVPKTVTLTKIPVLLDVKKVGVWKDADRSNGANAGDQIDYTFTVTNKGLAPLTDVKIIDSVVSAEPASIASLAPGEVAVFKALYTVTQDDIDNGLKENTATTAGTLPDGTSVESPPSTAIVEFPPELGISTEKSGRFLDDLVPNEFPDAGEHLEFAVKVKNSGNVSMVAYPPIDQGPTINGKPMTGELSAFSPDMHTIPPGEEAVFTALYTLTEQDINEASGVLDGVENTVDTPVQTLKEFREGVPVRNHPLEKPSVMTLPGYAIDKQAQVGTVTRGMMVPYVIKVRPVEASGEAMLVDQLPIGFSYVPGSARMDGVPVQPKIEGRTLTMDFEAENGVEKRIEYMLVVTGAVALGTFENTAQVFLPGQPVKPVSRKAIAEVDVVPDPVFDCGTVVGAVFDDQNRNGYQDKGEKGLAGARIGSVDGVLVTTDAHGRFNVACADLPDGRVGKTYLMKLDPRSLPTGYRILSENPRSVRLTAGKVSKLSFAASIGRVVRLDIDDHAFLPGEVNLQPQWQDRIANVVELLRSEPTIFRIVYKTADAAGGVHVQRVKSIKEHLSREWNVKANNYRLEIEISIMYANK